MKVAVIGPKNLYVKNLGDFLPKGTSVIVTGGVGKIDLCAVTYAKENSLGSVQFVPDYDRFGRPLTLRRDQDFIDYADAVVIFWKKNTRDVRFAVEYCRKTKKNVSLYITGKKTKKKEPS